MELVVRAVLLRVYASLVIQIQIVLLALMEQFQDVRMEDVNVNLVKLILIAFQDIVASM